MEGSVVLQLSEEELVRLKKILQRRDEGESLLFIREVLRPKLHTLRSRELRSDRPTSVG